jgi:hypothetical protein
MVKRACRILAMVGAMPPISTAFTGLAVTSAEIKTG